MWGLDWTWMGNFFDQAKQTAIEKQAEEYVDIEVSSGGVTKSFTKEEFVTRLLFSPPVNMDDYNAPVAKLVEASDLKSDGESHEGSNPSGGIK